MWYYPNQFGLSSSTNSGSLKRNAPACQLIPAFPVTVREKINGPLWGSTGMYWLVRLPLWKIMDFKSVGMMTFPIWWESHKKNVPNHQPDLVLIFSPSMMWKKNNNHQSSSIINNDNCTMIDDYCFWWFTTMIDNHPHSTIIINHSPSTRVFCSDLHSSMIEWGWPIDQPMGWSMGQGTVVKTRSSWEAH